MTDYTTQRLPPDDLPGHALVQELLPAYLDGNVSHESHVLIEDHLQRCERCSGYLAGLQATRERMRREQQELRAAQTMGPSVAQLRQPVVDTFGVTLGWTAITAAWLGGLVFTFVATVASDPVGIVLGALAVLGAVAWHARFSPARGSLWYGGMLAMAPLGLFMIAHPRYDHFNGVPQTTLSIPFGIIFLVVATWGLWPRRGPQWTQLG
jgi:predicted anti-sigma-YlaC factor YlaD